MAGALADGPGGSTGTRLESLEGRAFADDCFLDDQFVGRELVVVFGVGDRALESLSNELGRLLGSVSERVQGIRNGEPLDFTGDVACFLGRNTGVFGG